MTVSTAGSSSSVMFTRAQSSGRRRTKKAVPGPISCWCQSFVLVWHCGLAEPTVSLGCASQRFRAEYIRFEGTGLGIWAVLVVPAVRNVGRDNPPDWRG